MCGQLGGSLALTYQESLTELWETLSLTNHKLYLNHRTKLAITRSIRETSMGYKDQSWLLKDRGPLDATLERPSNSNRPNKSGKETLTSMDWTRPKAQVNNGSLANGPWSKLLPNDGTPKMAHKAQQQQCREKGKSHQPTFNMHQPAIQIQPEDRPDMLLKHEFRPGMIIHAPLFEEDRYQNKSCGPSEYRSIAAQGMVFGKPRYMIVVGLHYDHYIAVGIYTHEGKGLANKPNHKGEYVSVRDGRIPKGKYTKLSDHKELVTNGVGSHINPLSTAWYTRPISRSYDLRIKCEGSLTEDSLNRLCDYIKRANDRMLGR